MTGIETAAAGVLVRMVIERGAPAGLDLIRAAISGKSLMVVGPPAAGKTTFVDYLHYGIFQDPQEYEKTYEQVGSAKFNLNLGPDGALKVIIREAVDVPGQFEDLPDRIYEKRPHALVVVLDASAPLDDPNDPRSSAVWLERFFGALEQKYQDSRRKKIRLRRILVLLNKMDLVKTATMGSYEERLKSIASSTLGVARGSHVKNVVFKRCILVENPDKTKLVDAVLIDLAKSLTS